MGSNWRNCSSQFVYLDGRDCSWCPVVRFQFYLCDSVGSSCNSMERLGNKYVLVHFVLVYFIHCVRFIMKKLILASVIASSVFLVGCGEDKTPDQIKYEQEKEMLAMKLAHEREMARIDAKKISAANPVSHTYVENEYDQRNIQQDTYQQDVYQQEQRYGQADQSHSQPIQNYADQGTAVAASGQVPQQQAQQPVDEGFGMGSMALAALGGAAAGYFAGEMLNNGMKSYKDDQGNTHYTDKDGRPVSRAQYDDYKKKNPKTTAFKQKASDLKAKTVAGATAVKGKVVDTKNNVMNSDRMQQFKQGSMAEKQKLQETQKYQQSKTYIDTKKQAVDAKMNSRIPSSSPQYKAPAAKPPVYKAPPKPVYKAPSRPTGKRR